MAELREYLWMCVVGGLAAFLMAFGIGANDVANAFASSVSAKSLTLGQAILIAAIFEFTGSVLLGQAVTGTIRGKILDTAFYKNQPDVLMFGNLCALIFAGIVLMGATALELPVSTTHTIVAAIIGFSLAAEGFDSILWGTANKIFLSWLASPSISGVISFIFYTLVKYFVLHSEHVFERAVKTYPLVVMASLSVNTAFIFSKSEAKINGKFQIEGNFQKKFVLPAALGIGLLSAIIVFIFIGPVLRKLVERHFAEEEAAKAAEEAALEAANNPKEIDEDGEVDTEKPAPAEETKAGGVRGLWSKFADNTYRQDLKTISLSESARANEIWMNDEVHDPRAERLFSYLQVFTACMASFSHGANDVANAIAPFAAILDIYKTGKLNKNADVPKWILAMGGFGIVCGATLYGYKIIKAVGFKLTCITPSRGFCIELAAAMAVSVASYMEIPVSTTQCLVGATVGAGVASGGLKNVQWLFLLRVSIGWAGSFLCSCVAAAGFFSYCAYSPSLMYDD